MCIHYNFFIIVVIFKYIFYRGTGESSFILINNNVACLYHYAKKPTLAFTSIYKSIVQHQKNISNVTKPTIGKKSLLIKWSVNINIVQ